MIVYDYKKGYRYYRNGSLNTVEGSRRGDRRKGKDRRVLLNFIWDDQRGKDRRKGERRN